MTTDKNNAAPDPQPAELAEQQAIAEFLKERDEALGCPDATDAERAESARLIAALAATGKQQVGEVQGDALVPVEPGALAASIAELEALMEGECIDPLTTSESESVMLVLHELGRLRLIAARQPGAQEELHGFLKNSTPLRDAALRALGFIDRSDAHGRTAYDCLRRELHAECAAPPAQGIDLGPVRSALQAAEGLCACCASVDGYSRNELYAFGLNMRSQFREALALIDQRDAAPGVDRG